MNYCGISLSDIHMLRNEHVSSFPLVPGHEVIGIAAEKGSIVEHFK